MTNFLVQDVKNDPSPTPSDEMTPQDISETMGNIKKYYMRIMRLTIH